MNSNTVTGCLPGANGLRGTPAPPCHDSRDSTAGFSFRDASFEHDASASRHAASPATIRPPYVMRVVPTGDERPPAGIIDSTDDTDKPAARRSGSTPRSAPAGRQNVAHGVSRGFDPGA